MKNNNQSRQQILHTNLIFEYEFEMEKEILKLKQQIKNPKERAKKVDELILRLTQETVDKVTNKVKGEMVNLEKIVKQKKEKASSQEAKKELDKMRETIESL